MLQKIAQIPNQMTLSRMGSRYPSRLSFSRSMLRKFFHEKWQVSNKKLDLDKNGYGTIIYEIKIKKLIYSLVCFSQHIDDKDRSDRVIAEKWDTAYTLYNGKITKKELSRLKKNIPLQESGRNSPKELILSRANKSVRLFKYVIECLSQGIQPNKDEITKVGYLLRTTAVYGSGKFGLSDFQNTKEQTIFNQPFRAEMLAVYLIREFSVKLVEHIAYNKDPKKAVKLDKNLKQYLGIGNSTGLGMAPFIIKHPKLINKWMSQFNIAINQIKLKKIDNKKFNKYKILLLKALHYLNEVSTNDDLQKKKNKSTALDLNNFIDHYENNKSSVVNKKKWEHFINFSELNYNFDTQEIIKVQLIELFPEICDPLADNMAENEDMNIDGSQSIQKFMNLIKKEYKWALDIDFENKKNRYLFWYTSVAKLEPRLGERFNEKGSDLEEYLGVGKMVSELYNHISQYKYKQNSIGAYLLENPKFRGIIRRIQTLQFFPYAEVKDNILNKKTLAIDMLRFKLSFFGANRYDPKSDRWVRVSFFSGAPYINDLNKENIENWGFATMDSYN